MNLKEWLEPLKISVAFLSGSVSSNEKENIKKHIMQGDIDLLIGTHALIQDNVKFKCLALYIIDEQHRFGVEQRLSMRVKNTIDSQYQAHQLMMSATPIPRTLSMSYFADMDISTINELPPGRQTIKTKLIADSRRTEFLSIIQSHCKEGNQVYWVCPLIEESENLDLIAVNERFEYLKSYFKDYNISVSYTHLTLPTTD